MEAPRGSHVSFVLASLPAALIGVWNLGSLLIEHPPGIADTWQLATLMALRPADGSATELSSLLIGAIFFVPLLLTSLAVSRFWAEIFARLRRRPLDDAWMLWAWLYTLLLPPTMPIAFALIGLSFGAVFGGHVFGGTGRYIVNPALLGMLFLIVAYPGLAAETQWLPGADLPSSWALVAAQGPDASTVAGLSWARAFVGREIGALGTGSALACLIGVVALMLRRDVPPALVAAGLVGLSAASTIGGELPWHWHIALGNFAFALAFVATDPTTRPRTTAGLWAFGALFGALTIVLRTANPDHPEGTLFALVLASLCVPLLDRIAAAGRRRGLDGASSA